MSHDSNGTEAAVSLYVSAVALNTMFCLHNDSDGIVEYCVC